MTVATTPVAPAISLADAISPELALRVLARALRNGGDFAELYAEHRFSEAVSAEDGRLDRATSGVQLGASVRLQDGDVWGLAFAERLDEDSLFAAADAARAASRRSARPGVVDSVSGTPPVDPPTETDEPREARIRLVERGERAALACDPRIRQASVFLGTIRQAILVANSEGRYLADERRRLRYRVQAIARDEGRKRVGVGSYAPGVTRGFDYLDEVTPEQIAGRAAEQALAQLNAAPAPAAEMPVVLGNGVGGILVHEACGHGLEADAVLKRSSLYASRLRTQVASPLVTVVDDGSLAGCWGSAVVDDEGEATGPTALIEAGTLAGYLSDRRSSRALGIASTGNGRRASFRHLPFPRMSNTYVLPGEATPDEVIEDTGYGLYARSLSGGQANPSNGSFTFTVREGYLIRKGRIDRPVVGATVAGRALEALGRVDAVAGDLDVVAANCAREGQRVFVGVGQPTLRIAKLVVGGTVPLGSAR